jgi:hypothetical protein
MATQFEFADTVTFAGAVIVGKVTSKTVTDCVAVAVLPAKSVTVHVTIVFPKGKVVGALLVVMILVQLSLASGVPKTTPVAVQLEFALTVTAEGAVIVGFVLSTTVTTCVAVAIFPALSVNVHVTVVLPIGKDVGALLVTLATLQLSVVYALPNKKDAFGTLQLVDAEKTTFPGGTIIGKPLSTTVTVWDALLLLPLASVIVQTTVVAPKGYTVGALFVTELTVQLSVAIGFPRLTLKATQFAFADTVIFAGAEMDGSVLSVTVTNCVAVEVFPVASVAVQVTVVCPIGKVAGALFVIFTDEQLSLVTGVPNATPVALHDAFAETETADGAVIIGEMLSKTITVCVAEILFAFASVNVQVIV